MIRRALLTLAIAGMPALALAQNAQGTLVTPVDQRGVPFGTAANPIAVTGGSGGGGSTGSVTAAGVNGTTAQAVQGITGGVPVPVSGSFFQATQPVSNAGTFAVQNTAATPTGTNVIGSTTLRATGTNRSASVTTTASTLMAANANRQGWKIKNDCAVAVWINFDTTATATAGSGNMQIAAGAYMSSEPGFVETGAMSVIAASGTCALTAREH